MNEKGPRFLVDKKLNIWNYATYFLCVIPILLQYLTYWATIKFGG
jgi:hypothetical protein